MTVLSPIQQAATWLSQSSTAVAFTGAGISTPSGIPDFRSADSGLWEHADPMKVASIFGFRHHPRAFYDWVRPLAQTILNAQPNTAHQALATLGERGLLHSVITQNIDMLHGRAGNQRVHELHGHLRQMTCIRCFRQYPSEAYLHRLLDNNEIPYCECGGILKPDCILFGEQLPYEALQSAKNDARQCDLMLIIGSSLEVEPASSLPILAQRSGAKLVLINLEPTFLDERSDLVFHEDAAQLLPRILACLEDIRN